MRKVLHGVSVKCGDVPIYKKPVVCHEAQVVYLPIGKVASSSIKHSLEGPWDFVTKDRLVLDYPTWPRVAVIRDPLHRLESAYRYFKGKQSLLSPFPDRSFAEFVTAVCNSPDDVTDCHLRSQVGLLTHDGEFLPTVLIPFEELSRVKEHLPITTLIHNEVTTSDPRILTRWNKEMRQMAQDRYRADLRLRDSLTS